MAMGGFQNQLLNELNNRGKGDIANAIGMPDEQDYETLLKIIKRYERKHPGYLQYHVETIRKFFNEGKYGGNVRFRGQAEVNKYSRMRHAVDLPMDLGMAIEKVFPSMFRSKKHLRWFCQKFPGLSVSGKPL